MADWTLYTPSSSGCKVTRSLTDSLTHSLTHSLIHLLTHTLTHTGSRKAILVSLQGQVPKNEYGNIELFQPSMLPEGALHMTGSDNMMVSVIHPLTHPLAHPFMHSLIRSLTHHTLL